jgi:hypothetical protein
MILTKFNSEDEADLYRQACLTACSAISMACGLTRSTAEEICSRILADAADEPTEEQEIDFEQWRDLLQTRLGIDDKTFWTLYPYFTGACNNVSDAWEDLRGKV